MKEVEIQDRIRLELGDVERYPEIVLWRNNTGQMIDKDNRRVVFGCGGKGAADLIGMWTHTDGRAQFVALEVKTPIGRLSPEQKLYQQLIERKGGVYAVVRSVEDARAWVDAMRRKAA